jgi:hypothetical protein
VLKCLHLTTVENRLAVPSAKTNFLDNSVFFRRLYNCTSTNRITTPYQGAENKNNSSSTTTSDHALCFAWFKNSSLIVECKSLWAHRLQGLKVVIYCDNSSSVTVVNSGACRNSFMQSCRQQIC